MPHILRLNEMQKTQGGYGVVYKYRDKGNETLYTFKTVPMSYKLDTYEGREGFAVKNLSKQEANNVRLFMTALEFSEHPTKNDLTKEIPVGYGYGTTEKDSLFLLYLLVSQKDGPGKLRELARNVYPRVYSRFSYKTKSGIRDFYKTHRVEYTDIKIVIDQYGGDYVLELPSYSFEFPWDSFYSWR